MGQVHVMSREYKIMLRAGLFAGDTDTLVHQAGEFWQDFAQAINPHVFDTDGSLNAITKQRYIRFYDTKDQHLYNNHYIFRERIDTVSGDREVTLKFRLADRYVAQDRCMDAAKPERGKSKFEEDIKLPFQSLYSFSTTQKISSGKRLNLMDDPGRLYPHLPEQLDTYRDTEPLLVVGNFTAQEFVLTGADFQIGKDPKVEATCALVVWYDVEGAAQKPNVVEFSFKYGDKDETYPREVAQRAYQVFQVLQDKPLAGWVDLDSQTKTGFIYDMA